jgi:nucleoside-diphosphate-sugar epimerase
LKRIYLLDKPKGVNGRSSDNTLIKKVLNWNYQYSLSDGIKETYKWIKEIKLSKDNINLIKFSQSSLKNS